VYPRGLTSLEGARNIKRRVQIRSLDQRPHIAVCGLCY